MVGECVAAFMTLRVDGEDFALADLSISTADPAYVQTRKMALGLLLTFVPAVPLLIFGSLFRKRAQLRTEEGQKGLDLSWKVKFFYFYGKLAPRTCWLVCDYVLIVSTPLLLHHIRRIVRLTLLLLGASGFRNAHDYGGAFVGQRGYAGKARVTAVDFPHDSSSVDLVHVHIQVRALQAER